MKKLLASLLLFLFTFVSVAQDIPESISYTQIYDFIDELAIDKVISVNSVVKPYSRNFIAQKLVEAQAKDSLLTKRQKADLKFFLNDYALERDTMPTTIVSWTDKTTFNLSLLQPAFHYYSPQFKARITPILGMDILANKKGVITKRWFGAEFQATIMNHLSVYGSYRDRWFIIVA